MILMIIILTFIPISCSSDHTRLEDHGTYTLVRQENGQTLGYSPDSGVKISLWPCPLGLATTFSPELVEEFGKIASEEYRALGITTALSPQIDLATEPQWSRFYGIFGESPRLDADMARAYIDRFQTSYDDEIEDGCGYNHDDVTEGRNGYVPISLQYEPYHADSGRRESIAGGDREESFSNRSYHGKMTSCSNPEELTRNPLLLFYR